MYMLPVSLCTSIRLNTYNHAYTHTIPNLIYIYMFPVSIIVQSYIYNHTCMIMYTYNAKPLLNSCLGQFPMLTIISALVRSGLWSAIFTLYVSAQNSGLIPYVQF